ncbi:MAG: DegT/DnrJ/EryC1/StrS family aminotransferase [Oscillospiraceae bacterium]
MNVSFSPPDMTELEAKYASEAILSGWITTGPKTKEFEKKIAEYCGVKRVACLNSATAAMELSLRMLGIGAGDEVITSAYTYTASASVIDHVGAKIVLVDTLPNSTCMDLQAVANAITDRTKAIIPVDIAGVPADYNGIKAIIEKKKSCFRPAGELQKELGRIAIVADAAHSFGASLNGKNVACFSDFCCFSFHAVKNLTTAEGGAIAFSDIGSVSADEIYKKLMLWSLHGQSKDALAKTQLGAWEYDIIYPAYKCNMTDIMAGIGLAQLERYDGMLKRRFEMVARYNRFFEGTEVKPIAHSGDGFIGSHHLYITTVDGINSEDRNEIIIEMAKKGVSANVHYKPLPMMTAYKNLGFDIADFPHSYKFFEKEITLPLHTSLSDEQIDYTAKTLLDAIAHRKG